MSAVSPARSGKYDDEILTQIKFPIRNIASSAKYLRVDKIKNTGAAAKANIIKARLDAALKAHGESMAQSLYYEWNLDVGVGDITITKPI